jgi:hypothetical protein
MPATFGATFGIPAGVSHLVAHRRGGMAVADLEILRNRRAAPRGLPVAGLGMPVSAPRSSVLAGSAFTDIHRLRLRVGESQRNVNTGAPVSETPTGSSPEAAPAGAVFSASRGVGDQVLLPSVVAGIAKVAVALSAHERAARLFGAAEHLRGFTAILHRQGRWILFEHLYEQMVAKARDAIGDEAFDSAFGGGQTMASDVAINYAMDTLALVQDQ